MPVRWLMIAGLFLRNKSIPNLARKFWCWLTSAHTTRSIESPLKRTIQELLLDPLALKLLDGEFRAGDNIKVSGKDGELVFEKK